jgi:hypothetical protein
MCDEQRLPSALPQYDLTLVVPMRASFEVIAFFGAYVAFTRDFEVHSGITCMVFIVLEVKKL